MIPNVMGMSQHADGGVTMTRPYFSSSSYIKRMGPKYQGTVALKSGVYKWDQVWDALYYSFIDVHHDYLSKNYSTASQAKNWTKKSAKSKTTIRDLAREYIKFVQTDT
jgi:deoxyribodipyrimidine photolyase-related protein